MRFVLGIIGLIISSTAFAADHKVSLFLSETGGFHPLNIGKDAMPTVQADQHPDVPTGIFFQIAANGASQYEVVQEKDVLIKGKFKGANFVAAYYSTSDFCGSMSIHLKDIKGKVVSKTPINFECME